MILVCPRARAEGWEPRAAAGGSGQKVLPRAWIPGGVHLTQISLLPREGPAHKSSPGGSQLQPKEAPSRGDRTTSGVHSLQLLS